MHNRFFVTGTDTGVGKTITSILLAKGLESRYWKPVQTGPETESDTSLATQWLGRDRVVPSVYSFPEAVAPYAAALASQQHIDLERILGAYAEMDGPLVVEGAGGTLVPLTEKHLLVDLIQALDLGAIVVARTVLGTINHSLMTLEALRSRQIHVHGIIYVGDANDSSTAAIEKYGRTKTLGRIPLTSGFSEAWFAQVFSDLCKGAEFCRLMKK